MNSKSSFGWGQNRHVVYGIDFEMRETTKVSHN